MEEQTFLVALDITEDATDVVQAARKLADQCNANLICMTAVRPLAAVYGGLYTVPYAISNERFEQEAVENAQEKLLALSSRYGVNKKDVHTKLGVPVAEIRAAATEFNCDLLIMGTHARTGLGRLLGSTANSVLHGLPCDAYLVKVSAE